MAYLSIEQIGTGLREKRFSAVEVAKNYLDRIAARDGGLGAYLHVMGDDALAAAARVDAAIERGDELSALAGVPVAVKDTILVAGHPTTASAKVLESYVAAYDATAVTRMKANDAVLLGKTNCDEFAMGSSTENAALGKTVNAWDASRVPGGSSGGSATAVAADLACVALGSDTGGSIRQPAALSGIVGLKPTYGSVSRHGLIAMASSFDVIGPIARSVADVRTVFHAIRGQDRHDATSSGAASRPSDAKRVADLRVGIPKEYFGEGMDADVAQAVRDAIATVEGFGCRVEEVSLPLTTYALAVYYVLMPSEVSANLERYDGIRYGLSALAGSVPNAANLNEVYTKTRAAGFGPETKRRVMIGTYALSSGYADQYYKRALAVRNRIKHEYRKVFERVDVLLTPTTPTPAWALGAKQDDPLQMYLSDIFTVSANVAGIPGLSIPCGFVERSSDPPPLLEGGRGGVVRLPVGLQLLAPWFSEDTLFTLGEAYEQATDWHTQHPNA
ncbi:MAG: Asp-tRNA(Asn)/Glu-tRNA(Gln) amidotransferase subunit GatA [bacterium]|nr:Asp-tRNA(Asn)/Glu-tRNA(Gln) amidotransferase subunit GatA [bacterium]